MARIATFMDVHARRSGVVLISLLLLLLVAACAQAPLARPREGAAPSGGTPRPAGGPPPTLVGASVLSQTVTPTPDILILGSPSPSPGIVANPAGSPGAFPVISGLQPAPGTTLPAGEIAIGARVSASSNLADIIVYIDGEPIPIDLSGPPVRVKVVNMVRGFTLGLHELRIQARDDRGQLGGYRWQFTVGTARQSIPTAEPRSVAPEGPTATPFPVPTRRPTATPYPKPAIQTPGPAPKPEAPKPVIQPAAPTTVPVLIPAVKPASTPVSTPAR